MVLTAIPTNELGRMMRERIAGVLRMEAVRLDLNWTGEFPLAQIMSACDRMTACLDCTTSYAQNVQRELIQNEGFAAWLGRLLRLIAEKEAAGGTEAPQPDQRGLTGLLKECWANERAVTGYPEADVLFVLEQPSLAANTRLAYLENFAQMGLDDEARGQIVKNLSACERVPAVLDDNRRTLLAEPFVGTRSLFASENFEAVAALFQFCPALTDIARMLHLKGIVEALTLTDYQYFAEDGAEYLRLLALVLQRLDAAATGRFLHHWRQNNCALAEIQRMERRTRTAAGELDDALASYAGYVGLIYGNRFQNISLEGLTGYQEDLLIYAITHGKKHFIRLVDEHADQFLGLSRWSILFHEPLYRDQFNLNELTAKDLDDCGRMVAKKLPEALLTDGRRYTFPELKLLYNAPEAYVTLYGKLRSPSLDHRVRVLRQLRKRDVLAGITDGEKLSALAGRLDEKPLYDWRREEFGHVRDIQAEDAARMLAHLDQLRPLLPSIQCRTDAMLVLRSLEYLDRFDSLDSLKANLLEIDPDWQDLADSMELSPDFKSRHQEEIVRFLCLDSAGIAWTYLNRIKSARQPAFHRVVKAELMGRFSDLKYHPGDLEQELDYPLTTQAKVEWKENLAVSRDGVEVRERDDFFSTMLLGTQPYSTCLSYRDGAYCDCLLACFDSNKKVLYAEKNGKIVARACIRLTKCCLAGTPKKRNALAHGFSFVDLEAAHGLSREEHQGEAVALFLENPYTSGIGPKEQLQAETLFVELARKKAGALGAMLVLSLDYQEAAKEGFAQTRLSLYISASKAGSQYLDSLGGEASVSSEGSYRENNFLVGQFGDLLDKSMCT